MNNWTNKMTNEEVLALNIKERLHQTGTSKYGLPMEIIAYRNSDDIDINIDGNIVKHKKYKDFVNGNIHKTASDIRFLRIGETSVNSDGLLMTCIDYRLVNDIDIQFEDGTVLEHKNYYSFKKGSYKNPNYKKPKPKKIVSIEQEPSNRIGESNIAKNGMRMTIIAYRGHKDIDIIFDDGTIVTNKRYQHFKNGEINNPNISENPFLNQKLVNRVGETVTTEDGILLTIVNYHNRKDVDISLPDGTILKHRKYEKFKTGAIDCTTYLQKVRVGETNTNKDGLKMTILRYKNKSDIDIEFDNGTILTNTRYQDFLDGKLTPPQNKIGAEIQNVNGLRMKISNYNNCNDVDIEFEDGYILKNTSYRRFTDRTARHPFPYMLGTCQVEGAAYNYIDERNFFYICKCCHHHDIGTIDDILSHNCN